MKKRAKITIIALLSLAIIALSFGTGCALAARHATVQEPGLEVVEQARDIILDTYVDKDGVDATTLTQGAIKGMIEALDDPHSSYLDAETYQMSLDVLKGKFNGIGAYMAVEDEQLMVIAPIADSPAAQAGIRAGDIILEIDGVSALEISLSEAVLNIRGPKDTPVNLLVLHQNETEPVEIEIIRDEIDSPSIISEMMGDIAYINITYFTERTNEELYPVLESITQYAASGIILDLRSNPGGLIQPPVDIAGYFLEEGIAFTIVDNQGNRTPLSIKPNRIVTDLPLVVLVDRYTASSSEILAGTLQDHARATIAGTTTYGKGSINALYPLKDGSGIYVTTARWLTPNDYLIEGEGIHPDYELELEGEDTIQWAIDYLKS